jgi:hypothetical protein
MVIAFHLWLLLPLPFIQVVLVVLPLPFICDYCHFLLLVIVNFFSWQTLFLTNHHCCFSFTPLLWIAIVIAHGFFQHGANLGV